MIFGALSVWFVSRKEEWKRWGYIFGLIGQPFWLIAAIQSGQWGIMVMAVFYTYAWAQGIYNYWIKNNK